MKKIFILSLASILMLTGCGATETLSCTFQNTADNGSARVSYDIDHEQDEIKKVRITYDYNFNANNNDVNPANDVNNNGTAAYNTGDNGTNSGGNGANNNDNTTTGTNDSNMNGNTDARTGDNNNGGTNGNTGTTNGNNGTTNGNNGTANGNNGATNGNNNNQMDGVGTGTDGTTNDTQIDDDGIVDGIVGSAIDTIVGGVTSIILDSAGLRDRHATVQNTYGNVAGFSVQNTTDVNDNYKVTYVIDYDTISDDDLARFNLSRDLDTMRSSYVNQGFTCK